MTASGWPAALDAFEAVLGEQEVLVRDGRIGEVTAFVAPSGLGPCPPELTERALSLHRRAQALAEQVRTELARTGRQLSQVRRIPADSFAGPAYVDQRA